MGNLATTLAHARRADEAIALFEKLLHNAAQAEGTAVIEAHYQYAGGMAILGRFDAAFQHLEEAVARGFDAAGQLTSDYDLRSCVPIRGFRRWWIGFTGSRRSR